MKRITISVPDDVFEKARRAVDAGEAANISAFFSGAARQHTNWASARRVVNEMVMEAGGLSEADKQWSRDELGLPENGEVALQQVG